MYIYTDRIWLTVFPLCQICGLWKSSSGSPAVRIFCKGKVFYIKILYSLGTVLTFPIYQEQDKTFFDFYGMIQIVYAPEDDLLYLGFYETYSRRFDCDKLSVKIPIQTYH